MVSWYRIPEGENKDCRFALPIAGYGDPHRKSQTVNASGDLVGERLGNVEEVFWTGQ
jgi:hypothetical protein